MQRLAELPHSLALNALGFSASGRAIVKPATLVLPLAGRTMVLGPNGAGKSTLLQLIHGMLVSDQGSVGIRQAGSVERPVGAHELGFVLQRPVMLARSVLDNVTHALAVRGVARAEREPRARRVLARVGLTALESRPARRLSGGACC
jgi:tungstate transport system ATP-binding protein